MNEVSRIERNTVFSVLEWFSSLVFGYLFWFVLALLLAPEELGSFSAMYRSALAVVGLLFSGVFSALPKIIPEDEKNAGCVIFWTSLVVLGVNLALLPVLLILGIPGAEAVWILSLGASFLYLTNAALYSLQMMKRLVISNAVTSALKLVLAAALVLAGFRVLGPVAGFSVPALLVSAAKYRWLPVKIGRFEFRKLWKYSAVSLAGSGGGILLNQIPVILLAAFLSESSAGLFTVALVVAGTLKILPNALIGGAAPILPKLWTEGRERTAGKIIMIGSKFSALISIPFAAILSAFSGIALSVFPNYSGAAPVLFVLAPSVMALTLFSILLRSMYQIGLFRWFSFLSLCAGGVNAVLTAALIGPLGPVGAALSLGASSAVFLLLSVAVLDRRVPGLKRELGRVFAISTPFLAVAVSKLAVIPALAVYLYLVSKLGIVTEEERRIVKERSRAARFLSRILKTLKHL